MMHKHSHSLLAPSCGPNREGCQRPAGRALRIALAAASVACGACAAPGGPSALDARFGHALRDAQVLQTTAAPGAKGGTPAFAGVPARAAVTRHEQSFDTPARATQVMNIGIGASTGSR